MSIRNGARFRPLWLCASLLPLLGLAGVAAAPQPGKPAPHKVKLARGKVRRFAAPLRSVSEVEKAIAERKKRGEETDYLEAYLWRMQQRAFPYDRVDPNALPRAIAHRERMRPAVIEGTRKGVRAAISRRWEFIGPSNLRSPLPGFFSPGPFSGRINAVAYDPKKTSTYWVAAASGGVWKSTDSGQSWTFLSAGWPHLQVSSIAVDLVDPNTVYVGTGDFDGDLGGIGSYGFGVMKTTDGGANWTNLGGSQFQGASIRKIVIDPENPATLILTTGRGAQFGKGKVFRSTNGGQTWSAVLSGPSANWSDLVFGAKSSTGVRRLYAVAESANGEVWRSDDRGATWAQTAKPFTGTNLLGIDVAASPTAADRVYVLSATEKKVYRSVDAGQNWTDISAGIPGTLAGGALDNWSQFFYDTWIECSKRTDNNADVLFLGLIDLAGSGDGGATWATIADVYGTNPLIHPDQHCGAVNPGNPNEWLIGNDGGVYRVTYNPASNSAAYVSLNARIGITQFYHADFHPTDPARMLGGTQDNSTPVALGDLRNWDNKIGGDGGGCAINPKNPNTQYGTTQFYGFVAKTTDQWGTFTNVPPDLTGDRVPFIGELTVDPSNPNLVYIGSNFLWRRDESTGTWTKHLGTKQLAADPRGTIRAIAVAPSDTNVVYVGCTTGELWVSTDNGASFTQINTGTPNLPTRAITSIAVDPANPKSILVGFSGSGSAHLFRTADATSAARVWTNVSGSGANTLPDVSLNSVTLDALDPIKRWYVGTDVGVFRTADAGASWENMTGPLGLPNVEIDTVKVVPQTGYLMAASFGLGIWRIDPRAAPTGISVTFPNGAEALPLGQTVQLTWTSFGFPADHTVKIELSRDGGTTFPEVLAAAAPDTGSFDWAPTSPTGATNRIRITSNTDTTISDTSNADFSIVTGSFRVLAPNGGELFHIGDPITITWLATDFATTSPSVKIEISRDGGAAYTPIIPSAPNTGSAVWVSTGPSTDQARVRVTPTTLPAFADASDGDFEIRDIPTLHVDSPNGGEVFASGEPIDIFWNSTGVGGDVKIEYSPNGGISWTTIFASTPNDGIQTWGQRETPTKLGRLRITSLEDSAATDISDGFFSIVNPSIQVTAPARGRTVLIGTSEDVTWLTTGIAADEAVNVELSRDGGSTWEAIGLGTDNSGAIVWDVTGPASSSAVIRVSRESDPAVFGVSAPFTVAAPTLFVVNPNGREKWRLGDQQTIRWSGTSVGNGAVAIELSRNGGRTWETLFTDAPNNGAVAWGVQGAATRKALVRITWSGSESVSDRSNRVFSILKPARTRKGGKKGGKHR